MSSFEFLSVLISVVVGLGITHLLTGFGRLLHLEKGFRTSGAHLVWTLYVFLYLVVYWWTIVFGWQDWENWNILLFLFVLLYGVLLFLLCVVLYPADPPESWNPGQHFIDTRRSFFLILVLMLFTEFGDTALKQHFDDFALAYVLIIGSWIATSIVGWFSESSRVQLLIAAYQLVTLVAWVGYQFRDLYWFVAP